MPGDQRSRRVVALNGDVEASRDRADADAAGAAADRLRTVELEPVGRFADASNATLLVRLLDGDGPSLEDLAQELGHDPTLDDLDPDHLGVYKPRRGEAPLWDFPAGTLHRREVAAYTVSEILGWGLVPLTVLREDGPFGPGSLQRFVPHDPSLHYFRLLEVGSQRVLDALRRMVVFDLVIDNADRKGGHVLLEGVDDPSPPELDGELAAAEVGTALDGRIQLVDHGVAFNVERKLRTVAWEFAGEPVGHEVLEDLRRLHETLHPTADNDLVDLLSAEEIAVLLGRVERLLEFPTLPEPRGPRAYPWPPL